MTYLGKLQPAGLGELYGIKRPYEHLRGQVGLIGDDLTEIDSTRP